MKLRITDMGTTIGDVEISDNDEFVLRTRGEIIYGVDGGRVVGSVVLSRLLAETWRTAYAAGRAYDPRNEPRQDPLGLVGPSDSERIGHPWCPWCREASHYGPCATDPLTAKRQRAIQRTKGRRRGSQDQ